MNTTSLPAANVDQQISIGGGLGANTANMPQIEQLTQMINEINQRAQQTANTGRIPGGAGLEEQSSGNIQRALAGEVDPSVLYQLGQQAAQRGVSTGSPTGPNTNAQYLRSLGLTSQDLMNTGQNWLTQAVGRNPAAPIYNAGNMVITPEQQAQIDLQNRSLEEQMRSNRAREALSRSGGGGSGGENYGGGGGRAASPTMNWSDLFGDQADTRYAPLSPTRPNSGWEDDPFDWAWNGSTPYEQPTPSWVMPDNSFSNGAPDLGGLMDSPLYGNIGWDAAGGGANTGWEDDAFDWAWE